MTPLPRAIRLSPHDDVVVAVDTLPEGAAVQGVVAAEKVPRGHKMAARRISPGEPVKKFGQIIGFASQAIEPGRHVHTHNLGYATFERDYAIGADARPVAMLAEPERASFQGFRRADGRVGTRNYVAIVTSVNCSATVAKLMAEAVRKSNLLEQFPNVDGVIPITHGTGCGMAAEGEGYDALRRTIWGHATHPNVAATLFVGLGCEVFQLPRLKAEYGITEGEHFQLMTIQETGGTRKSIEDGVARLSDMLPFANQSVRETVPASEIVLALQCGGSDGYSGITANAALGAAVDQLSRHGGAGVLAETPEIYGAEHLLTRRAADRETGEKLVDIIRWWEAHVAKHGGSMDNNPSPGNKAGGLTTILEKSLGAAIKGGSTTLNGVYRYAEKIDRRGFLYMDTPGYDPVGATGQVAGGCNVMCFTTGRGSAFGCKPTPSIKLATNSEIFRRMEDDMDINCGDILDGVSVEAKGEEILRKVLAVASGEKTKSELLGYGESEFVPWQIGATM